MKASVSRGELFKSIYLLQPTRPFFCTTKNADGSDHVAPFAWLTPISASPPKVALALQNERGKKLAQSLVNVLREGEFGVNMPQKGQEYRLVESSFGLVKHPSKFDRTGYTRRVGQVIKAPLIEECTACLECKVYSVIETGGDHTLLLADVVAAHYEVDCYDENLCRLAEAVPPLLNLRDYRFDDYQRHLFIDAGKTYRVDVFYEKGDEDADRAGQE